MRGAGSVAASLAWIPLALAYPAHANPIELSLVEFTYGVAHVDGALAAGSPYEASVRVTGANIAAATLDRPGVLTDLSFDPSNLEVAFFGDAGVLMELPEGTYSINMVGTMGDQLSISFTTDLPATPGGLPLITSPDHQSPTVAATTLAWTCGDCVADELFIEVGDETLNEDAFVGFFAVGAGSVELALDPSHLYEFDVELSNLVSDGTQGDFLLLQRYRVENEVQTVPEPSTAVLLAAGLLGLAWGRRG